MKPLFLMTTAVMLGIVGAGCAQNRQQAVVAPVDRSTGPAMPGSSDTRTMDQNAAVPPLPSNATVGSQSNNFGNSNWRTSDGLNSDPSNPNGAPGPSTITSNPGH